MAITRDNRDYFRVENSTTTPNGEIVVGDRFRAGHEPTQETMFRALNSIAFISEKSDAASESQQGLVKTVNGTSAKNGTSPDDGFTYVATIENLPQIREVVQEIGSLTGVLISAQESGNPTRNIYDVKFSDGFLLWLSTELDKLSMDISSIDVDGINSSINSIESDITTIQGQISTIQSDITTIQGQIFTIQSDITTIQSDVQTNKNDIQSLQSQVSGFGGDSRSVGEYAFMPVGTPPSVLYLLCDGSAVSRSIYSVLFALIGTSFGAGNGSTTFNLPNFSGRGIRGYDSSNLADFGVAVSKGSDETTIATNNLPPHDHTVTTTVDSIALSDTAGTDNSTVQKGNGSSADSLDLNPVTTVIPSGGNGDALAVPNPYLVSFVYIKAQ